MTFSFFFSHVWLFATPWILVHGILQATLLQWAVMLSSRGSFQPRDQTCISCIGRWVLYRYCHLGSPFCFGVQPINNVIVSGEQQRDSASHILVSILPQTPLPYSCHIPLCCHITICHIVGLFWLSILKVAVCRCQSSQTS